MHGIHRRHVVGMTATAAALLATGGATSRAEGLKPVPVDLARLSATQLVALQAKGQLDAAAIAESVLERITAWDSRLRIFITVNPRLRADAARLDQERKAGRMGPLHGVPVAIKDNMHTAGLRTTGGSVLFSDFAPPKDARVVELLRNAGALIVGKANLDELAVSGSTLSSILGQTLNPHDSERFAAGSSGGSAVAVATGIATLALGTETVNSLRNAANTAGVVAIRPTHGLVSRVGVMPLSTTMDVVGPFARSVADAALVLDLLVGRDAGDIGTLACEQLAQRDFHSAATSGDLAGRRIGVLRNLFGTAAEHAEVNLVIRSALERAVAAGATLVEIDDAAFDSETAPSLLDVNNLEFRPLFERYLAEQGSASPVKTVKEYVDARRFPAATMQNYLDNAVRWANPLGMPAYTKALAAQSEMRARVQALFARHQLHALAYPIQKRPPLAIGTPTRRERSGIFASAMGYPAIDLPCGWTRPGTASAVRLPVGLDLMGLPFQDRDLIALAGAVERVLASGPRGA